MGSRGDIKIKIDVWATFRKNCLSYVAITVSLTERLEKKKRIWAREWVDKITVHRFV